MKYRIKDMLIASVVASPSLIFLHMLTNPDHYSLSQALMFLLCLGVYSFLGMGIFAMIKEFIRD